MMGAAAAGPAAAGQEPPPAPPPAPLPSRAEREERAGRLVGALVRRELGEGALGAEAEGFLARELAGAAAALRRPAPAPGEEPPPVAHPPALLLRDFLASPRPLPELEALALSLLRSILGDEEEGTGAGAGAGGLAGLACLRDEFPMFEDGALEAAWQGAGGSLDGARAALLEVFEAEFEPEAPGGPGAPPPRDLPLDEANFPDLGGAASARGASASGGSSWASAARSPAATAGPVETGGGGPPPPGRGQALASAYTGGRPGGGASAGAVRVSTGAAVAQDYAQAREEAAQHARARNACFEGATRAFQTGNKAAAKDLGRKGRWHNEQMKALHEAAARQTFRQRNSGAAGGGRGTPRTIDLHGLHVAEAVRFLAEELEGQRRGARVFVVVGTGHHSHYTQKRGDGASAVRGGGAAPRLAAAVEAFLAERGLAFSSPEGGLLQVTV